MKKTRRRKSNIHRLGRQLQQQRQHENAEYSKPFIMD